MRKLPYTRSQNQNIIIKTTQDFWGENKISRKIINTALWVMGRKKGIILNDEEDEAVWHIKNNLLDKLYRENIAK